MPSLVSIGDSFVDIARDARSFPRLLAAGLGLQLSERNPAAGASSLDHLFMRQWPAALGMLSHGDTLLIGLTNPDRTFFFPMDHMLSMPACVDDGWMEDRPHKPYRWSSEEKEALGLYYRHLHSDARNLEWLRSWFHYVDSTCSRLGIRALVLDCFDATAGVQHPPSGNIIRAIGSLSQVSRSEIRGQRTADYLARHVDPRINHMTLANHRILATKLLDAMREHTLDLREGFVTGCFDVSLIREQEWFAENIGDGHIDRRWAIERMGYDEEDLG